MRWPCSPDCLCASAFAETPLAIVETSLPKLNSGDEIHFTFHATGGAPPYAWTVDGNLPDGVRLSENGVLSGRPIKAGPADITIKVADSGHPPHEVERNYQGSISAGLQFDWRESPKVRDDRIDGSVKVTNGSKESYDLTVVVVAVASSDNRATTIGYEHFDLKAGTNDLPITFGNTLPPGDYTIYADAVAEIPARDAIYRQHLETPKALRIVAGP